MTKDEVAQAIEVIRAEATEPCTLSDARYIVKAVAHLSQRLDGINERQCNGHQTPSGNWDEAAAKHDEFLEERTKQRLADIACTYGLTFHVDGDPRGYAIKLLTPKTGRSNTWGGAEIGWGLGA